MDNLLDAGMVGLIGTVIAFFAIIIFLTKLYRRASKEIAFVRTGVGGEKVVMNGGALVFPIFHETMPVNMNTLVLSVVRRDGEALITLDLGSIGDKPARGLLAFGAEDAGRFAPEHGADLVAFLGGVTGRVGRRWLT